MTIRIALASGKYTLIDADDLDRVARHRWMSNGRYAVAFVKGKSLLLHRYLLRTPVDMDTDHINGNGLDNRRSNLRIATRSQNIANSRLRRQSSGYRGVYKKYNKYWVAQITHHYKRINLGYFDSRQLAAKAYNDAAKQLFGEFARLNIISN